MYYGAQVLLEPHALQEPVTSSQLPLSASPLSQGSADPCHSQRSPAKGSPSKENGRSASASGPSKAPGTPLFASSALRRAVSLLSLLKVPSMILAVLAKGLIIPMPPTSLPSPTRRPASCWLRRSTSAHPKGPSSHRQILLLHQRWSL